MSDITSLPKAFPKAPDNETNDIIFTKLLLRDLENLLCIDTSRIYATGLGTGGGMMHLLACDDHLSTRIAAFAAVAAGFGVPSRKDKQSPWNECKPGRAPVPILDIHGGEDRIFGYWLREGENGKSRRIPPHWVEEWAERNGCGEAVDDAVQSTTDQGTFITKLEHGLMSEAAVNAGAVIKTARSCKPVADDALLEAAKPEDVSVLHYRVKRYGHGWPRLQLKKEDEVIIQGTQVKPTGDVYFDTTRTILDFFGAHRLPAKLAVRKTIKGFPGDDDVEAEVRELKEAYIARAEKEKKEKAKEDGEDEEDDNDRDEL
jgi:poly(3-hydroxybutyrate) depolymerase